MTSFGAHAHMGTMIIVAIILGMAGTDGARILFLNSFTGNVTQSHFFVTQKVAKHLGSRGHQVTLAVSVHQTTPQSSDVEYVKFSSALSSEEWHDMIEVIRPDNIQGTLRLSHLLHVLHTQRQDCETILSDEEFYNRLKKEHFDVAVVDAVFVCGFLYARRLGLKFISFEIAAQWGSVADTVDPFPLSYVPVMFSELTDKMNFFERLYNAFVYYGVKTTARYITHQFEYLGQEYEITRGETVADVRNSAELYLLNYDFAFEFPRPLPTNIIMTGCVMAEPAKPLPEHFEEILNSARFGVIIVSFGSYKDIGSMPQLRDNLIEGLTKLPQLIIWSTKYRPATALRNILTYDWIPQNDLLAHPNVKAYVYQGGINGLSQGIYHGVPTLVIPGGFDCMDNAVRIQGKGMGLIVRPLDLTPEVIQSSLSELINNKTYKSNAKRLSAIMRDRILSPLETASFWIEHVIRHGGASHLRSAGNDLSFVELNMLDVKLAFLTVCLTVVYGMYTLCICCCRRCKSSPKKFKAN